MGVNREQKSRGEEKETKRGREIDEATGREIEEVRGEREKGRERRRIYSM